MYSVRTKSTSATGRTKIAESHLLIAELEYDVDSFNTLVEYLVKKLAVNGEHTEDLFSHIAHAYKNIPDAEFHPYITAHIDSHNDGTIILYAKELMNKAKTKYDELLENKAWMKQGETEKQQVALNSQLQQVDLKNQVLTIIISNKPTDKDNPKMETNNRTNNGQDGSKWEWKAIKLKGNEPDTKTVDGKNYWFCPWQKKFVLHNAIECRLKRTSEYPKDTTPSSTTMTNLQDFLDDEGAFSDE